MEVNENNYKKSVSSFYPEELDAKIKLAYVNQASSYSNTFSFPENQIIKIENIPAESQERLNDIFNKGLSPLKFEDHNELLEFWQGEMQSTGVLDQSFMLKKALRDSDLQDDTTYVSWVAPPGDNHPYIKINGIRSHYFSATLISESNVSKEEVDTETFQILPNGYCTTAGGIPILESVFFHNEPMAAIATAIPLTNQILAIPAHVFKSSRLPVDFCRCSDSRRPSGYFLADNNQSAFESIKIVFGFWYRDEHDNPLTLERTHSIEEIYCSGTYDLAFIKVQEPIDPKYIPAISLESFQQWEHKLSFAAGYPGIDNEVLSIPLHFCRGRVTQSHEDPKEYFYVDLQTFPGNSGSPVFLEENGAAIGMVLGIHPDRWNEKIVNGRPRTIPRPRPIDIGKFTEVLNIRIINNELLKYINHVQGT